MSHTETLDTGTPEPAISGDPQPALSASPQRFQPRAAAGPVHMPASIASTKPTRWRDVVRHFHLTGKQPAEPLAAEVDTGKHLSLWAAPQLDFSPFPLVWTAEAAEAGASLTSLQTHLEGACATAKFGSNTIVLHHLPRLVAACDHVVCQQPDLMAVSEVFQRARAGFCAGFDLSPAAHVALASELNTLACHLGKDAYIVGLSETLPLTLYVAAQLDPVAARRAAFGKVIAKATEELANLIQLDDLHHPQGQSAEALASALGAAGSDLFDPAALAKQIKPARGSKALGAERRQRIETTRAVLEAFAAQLSTIAPIVVVHSSAIPACAALDEVHLLRSQTPWQSACERWDQSCAQFVAVFRALRIARLEADHAYDDELHGDPLTRFGWQACTPEELGVLPTVAVYEQGSYVRDNMGALIATIRSHRPIHTIVADTAAPLKPSAWTSLGYLLATHHRGLIWQTNLLCCDHLAAGLRRLQTSPEPAVLVVTTPVAGTATAGWLQLAAAHDARCAPSLAYDPALGTTWAECLVLAGNSEPTSLWPRTETDCLNADATPQTHSLAWTAAHAAALDSGWHDRFWVIPTEAWSDEQLGIEAYVEQALTSPVLKVPYIWIVDAHGTLARAIMTHDVVVTCLDVARGWRLLQELAGIDNQHARAAAKAAREQALAEAALEREDLLTAHNAKLETIGEEAAAQAVESIVAQLVDIGIGATSEFAPLAATAMPALAVAAAAQRSPTEPLAQPDSASAADEAEDDDDGGFDEPYIDSILCTTCNECTNLNSLLFKYNDDKQAYIADASAGTFVQLVQAAEKCPAKCIHPGKPRAGDATATAAWVERAAPFN